MKKRALFFFSLAVMSTGLPCAAFAQSAVVPGANANTSGGTYSYLPFGEQFPTVMQVDVAASQLTGLVGDDIDSIGFRLAPGASSVAAGTVIGDWTLELSSSLNSLGSLSAGYEDNIGADAETVYSGSLTLGALTGGAGVNPFFDIDFTTPYLYEGGDLLYTLEVSGATNQGIAVDAISEGMVEDTVGYVGSSRKQAQFFTAPVTQFGYSAPFVADSVQPAATPEPSSLALLLTGAGAVGMRVRRRFARA